MSWQLRQRGKTGRKGVTHQRADPQLVGAVEDDGENEITVSPRHHLAGRRGEVNLKCRGRTARIAAIARTGHVNQLDGHASDGFAGAAVIHHTAGVDQQGGGRRSRDAATGGGGGGQHIVTQHLQDAVARSNDPQSRIGGRHIGQDAEQAGIGSGFHAGIGFRIAGELAHQRDGHAGDLGWIGIARRSIRLHEQGIPDRVLERWRGESRSGKKADAHRMLGQ